MRTNDYQSWKEELATSLSMNSEKYFSKRQPALAKRILESTFPDPTILSYYSHPVVSSEELISAIVPQWRKPDIPVLAELCKRLFEWNSRWGMVRFMRSITPGLLLYTIIHRNETTTRENRHSKSKPTGKLTDYFKSTKPSSSKKSPTLNESIFLAIHGTRKHKSTDSLEELRLSYIPSKLQPYLPLNFALSQYTPVSPVQRPKESSELKDSSDEEFETFSPKEAKWSPDDVERIWIPKVYVEKGYPREFADWERSEIIRKTPKKGKNVIQVGAMDQFVRRESEIHGTMDVWETMQESPVRKSPAKGSVGRKENTKSSPTKTIRKENISIINRRKENIPSSTTKKLNTSIINMVTPTKSITLNTPMESWTISSDSDSDSLPSPTNMLSYTPKTSRTKTIEDVPLVKVTGNVVGTFRESFGGTLYEIDNE